MIRTHTNRLFWSAILLLTLPSRVLAGNEGAAGGDGVLVGDKVFMLDLVESGVEEFPWVDQSLTADPAFEDVKAQLGKFLANLNDSEMRQVLALKLLELSKRDHVLALLLLQTIEQFTWNKVNHELVDIPDDDSILQFRFGQLIQVAIRRNKSILISRLAYEKMSPENRAAMVMHESIYALMATSKHRLGGFYQSSPVARTICGFLFTQEFRVDLDSSQLNELITGGLPTGRFTSNHYVVRNGIGSAQNFKVGYGNIAVLDFNLASTIIDETLAAKICAELEPTYRYLRIDGGTFYTIKFATFKDFLGNETQYMSWDIIEKSFNYLWEHRPENHDKCTAKKIIDLLMPYKNSLGRSPFWAKD